MFEKKRNTFIKEKYGSDKEMNHEPLKYVMSYHFFGKSFPLLLSISHLLKH